MKNKGDIFSNSHLDSNSDEIFVQFKYGVKIPLGHSIQIP